MLYFSLNMRWRLPHFCLTSSPTHQQTCSLSSYKTKKSMKPSTPCSIRRAGSGRWRCLRPRWCSSWPWWRPSAGSPGTTAMPRPRWCMPAAPRGKSSRWGPPPPDVYWWTNSFNFQTQIRCWIDICFGTERPSDSAWIVDQQFLINRSNKLVFNL